MKILQKYNTYNKHKDKLESEKEELFKMINVYLEAIFKTSFCSNNNIHIERKFYTKEYCTAFVDMEVLIITESDDNEYVRSKEIPMSFFKLPLIEVKKAYDNLIKDYYAKADERRRQELELSKQNKEKEELKEYKRLKRKYGNK